MLGLGNNGGDGMVMARHLAGHNADVRIILLGSPLLIKTEESKWNLSILKKMKSVDLMQQEIPGRISDGPFESFDFKL